MRLVVQFQAVHDLCINGSPAQHVHVPPQIDRQARYGQAAHVALRDAIVETSRFV